MEIRTAPAGDAPGIATVQVETWRVAYRGQVPDAHLDALSIDDRTGRWRHILADSEPPSRVAIVADDGHAVVGFAHIGECRDADAAPEVGELNALYVLPGHWDTGVGRRLIEAAEARLAAAGFASATLWVLDSNARGRRFYEAAGWAPDGATQLTAIGDELVPETRYRKAMALPPR
ncbi:MAG: GNAT family N-acetyltransferase [Acidimicrobiales bacterium]